MTALEFMAGFRDVTLWRVGRKDGVAWALIEVDEDGTEPQVYFVMESMHRVRYLCNPSHDVSAAAMSDPTAFWDTPMTNEAERT